MNTLIGTSPLGLAMIKHNHATTAQEAKEIKALTATVKEQAWQIQKVSDQLARKLLVAKQETMTALQQNEFHATTDQEAKEIKALTATVKEQASQIQKVSDKVELNKPAPQMVGNNEKGPPDLQNY